MRADGDAVRPGADEVPALGAAPALKLGVFYGALVVTVIVSLLPDTGDLPFYLVLLLLFAGIPILGHQTIGLTPYRARTLRVRLYWTLGVLYPLVVLALGALLLLRLRPEALTDQDRVSIQRAALLTLFVEREQAKQLVFWNDSGNESPTATLLRDAGVSIVSDLPDTAALALPMPVHLESLATLERHFREVPDGWEAWFTRYPASSGIVVLTQPIVLSPGSDKADRAAIVIARTCGEHCHSAWRVTLARGSGTAWRTVAVEPLTLPRD